MYASDIRIMSPPHKIAGRSIAPQSGGIILGTRPFGYGKSNIAPGLERIMNPYGSLDHSELR